MRSLFALIILVTACGSESGSQLPEEVALESKANPNPKSDKETKETVEPTKFQVTYKWKEGNKALKTYAERSAKVSLTEDEYNSLGEVCESYICTLPEVYECAQISWQQVLVTTHGVSYTTGYGYSYFRKGYVVVDNKPVQAETKILDMKTQMEASKFKFWPMNNDCTQTQDTPEIGSWQAIENSADSPVVDRYM